MTAPTQKSMVQVAFFIFVSLLGWKIFGWVLNSGLWLVARGNKELFGQLNFYVLSPILLIVTAFFIGRAVTRYAEIPRYGYVLPMAIIGVITLQLSEYAIMDRLFDFHVSFPFLSRFIGMLFEASVFTIFLALGVYTGKRHLQHQRRDHLLS